jgi:hypothetical protein
MFIKNLLTILIIFSFVSCDNNLEFSEETLKDFEIGIYNITIKKICEPTALGKCFLDIYLEDKSLFGLFDYDKLLIRKNSPICETELSSLNDDLLLVKMRSSDGKSTDPHILVPIDITDGNLLLDSRFPILYLNKLNYSENDYYCIEEYNFIDDKTKICVHIWLKDNDTSHRNIFVMDATNVSCEFYKDDIIKIVIDWNGKRERSILYIALWEYYGRRLKIFYEHLPDSINNL